jgi:prefoldin subunit 5
MHNYKRGIIVLAVISLMIFTPLMAVFPLTSAQTTGTSAQTTASSPVGTVTLNPSSGAFPGQIVTYTWSGVPVDLVPPVYVTVYLNGAPYSTGVASYSNGVLTGTFTMPNDNPGTVFNVALSYTDSAHNYGVSAQLSSTGTVNAYVAPTFAGANSSTTAQVQFGVPYTLKADVNYTGITKVKTNFNGGSGLLNGYTNSTFNVSSSKTTLKTNATTPATLKLVTKYGGLVNFTSTDTKQNITINTTAYNGGAASLALPASNTFESVFTFSGNSITSIALNGSIGQTVNGQLVVFNLTGKYTITISSPGNYTMLGSVVATSPSSLAGNFKGEFSAAYYIKNYTVGSTNHVNYTLSITINGETSDSIVILKAQYLNTAFVSGKGSPVIYSKDTLTLQSGYTFSSIYIALENPGISGTFVNNFVYGLLKTGNLTFSFENWTSGQLSSIFSWYDNMSNIEIALNNQTLKGYLNMTITTNSYSPGVDYISPAIWNITNYVELNLTSPKGLKIIGTTKTTMQYNTTVLTSGATMNVKELRNFKMHTYFYDMLGYPYLTGFNVPYTAFTLNYSAMDEISVVQQNFTWSGNLNMSVGAYTNAVNSTVKGFNFTFSGKAIELSIKVTDVNPVMYGFTENGNVSAWVSLSGTLTTTNSYVSESYTGNFTPKLPATFNLVNQWNYLSMPTLKNITYAEYTITYIYGKISDAFITSGAVSFTSNEYQGYISVKGKSYTSATGIELATGQHGTSAGNITSVSGFGNTTILGWYNTTFTVVKVIPALYGLKAMNGEAVITANVSIDNVSHSLKVDPYYQGLQNASFVVTILSNTTVHNNATFMAIDTSQNLTIVGLGYAGYLNNLEITGTMSITDPIYNLTDNFSYSLGISKLPFFYSAPNTNFGNYVNFAFVSGDVPITYNESSATFYGFVGSPIENLTLTPLANFTLTVVILADNYSGSYSISGEFKAQYVTPFSSANNSVFEFSSEGLGFANITAEVQNSYLTLQGSANGITFTTNPVDVLNSGPIFVSGLTTGQFGSGTLTGTLNIAKLYPINLSNPFNPSQVVLSGQLTLQGFYANGTQYYTTVNLMNTVAGQSLYMALTTPMTAEFTTTLYSEMANTGMSSPISYPLLNGSGAMITGINNTMVAEIATLTGKYVNMSLSQLDAKIIGIYSELNNTYVSINTNFGVMEAQLSALNANITAVSNGVATIQTSLGTIQASLNSLNAKIVAINGTVATIKTDIGTINTSLASINAQLTSIQGNIATIQTSLGTIQGTVTSINGSVATIKTQLGTLQTSVNGVTSSVNAAKSSTSNAVTFEVLIMVLVLITLVIAIGTMLSANRMVRRLEELKKQ